MAGLKRKLGLGKAARSREKAHLQSLLVLLGLHLVYLLHGLHILLEVANRVLPRLQPLGEEPGRLGTEKKRNVSSCSIPVR